MTLPRPAIKKNSFAVQVPVCVALALVVDYFGAGLFFGHSTFSDFAKTLGFAFALFFGMRLMASYYEGPLGCFVVLGLMWWMMSSAATAAKAAGVQGSAGFLMALSGPLWAVMLASLASSAVEVDWRSHSKKPSASGIKEAKDGSAE